MKKLLFYTFVALGILGTDSLHAMLEEELDPAAISASEFMAQHEQQSQDELAQFETELAKMAHEAEEEKPEEEVIIVEEEEVPSNESRRIQAFAEALRDDVESEI